MNAYMSGPVTGSRVSGLFLLITSLSAGAALSGGTALAAPTQAPIIGEVQFISIADPSDPWSRGIMVVGGHNVILPRNLLIDLPANRLTLQQLYAEAPSLCQERNETGLAKHDGCNTTRRGAIATILANRTNGGDVIAGEIWLEKAAETVSGVVTYIDHTQGYFRVGGIPGDSTTGAMVRINDPFGRHTLQQGLGCADGPNCSADVRYGLDPDNYTVTFSTGYPACLPSTLTGDARTRGSNAQGAGDSLCPATNRGAGPVSDSYRFAPIQLGDHLMASGNFELINGVHFLSAHSLTVSSALTTARGQPDYMIFAEVGVDAAGFQNERIRALIIGFTTLNDSQLDVFALHHDPQTNAAHELPIASTVNNPDTFNQGVGANAGGIFKFVYDVDFLAGVDALGSPCVTLANAGFTPESGGCPSGVSLNVAENFSVLSPISREIIGRTRNKVDNGIGNSFDIQGNPTPNGEYLTPVAIGHPEFVEIDLNRIHTPLIFAGEPWNLDRRLGPGGCGETCESTPQPLDPFPYSGLDPRTQGGVPLSARDRILSFFPFGPEDVLAWPPLDPPAQGTTPTPPDTDPNTPPAGNIAPIALADASSGSFGFPQVIQLVANDTDSDGTVNPASVAIVNPPGSGRVQVGGNGSVTYLPNSGFAGTDSFGYTVRDNVGAISNVATVTVQVLPPVGNARPLARADSATVPFGTSTPIDVAANDTDPDGTINRSTVTIVREPRNGTALNRLDGTVVYTPNLGFVGGDSFTYTVQDNVGVTSAVATVSVNVLPIVGNTAPFAADDTVTTSLNGVITINLTANDSDPDGSIAPGTLTIVRGPDNGTLQNLGNGSVVYTPAPGFSGTDVFTYFVGDDRGARSNTARVRVNVTPVQEFLTLASAEYRIFTQQWRVDGTSSRIGPENTITIYAGPVVGGPVIGTATVDELGNWRFREAASPAPQSATISVQSALGTKLENLPVNIRN